MFMTLSEYLLLTGARLGCVRFCELGRAGMRRCGGGLPLGARLVGWM